MWSIQKEKGEGAKANVQHVHEGSIQEISYWQVMSKVHPEGRARNRAGDRHTCGSGQGLRGMQARA